MMKWCTRACAGIFGVTAFVLPSLGAGLHKKPAPPQSPAVRATVPPAYTIPIEPLGFSAPAPFYLGSRNALVSLDFLDEDHVLFTFRVPGLIHRDHQDAVEGNRERQVRALVL